MNGPEPEEHCRHCGSGFYVRVEAACGDAAEVVEQCRRCGTPWEPEERYDHSSFR
jgi:hypothetical protein